MKYEIYIVTNTVNAKQYVGITKSLHARWHQHKNMNGSSPYLHASIKKYGVDAFVFTHIATAYNLEFARQLEQILISEHNTKAPHGYNLTDGGEGASGLVFSEEARRTISNKAKAMWANQDHLDSQMAIRTSEEYRASQSKKAKEAWANPETRAKLKKPKNHGEKMRAIKLGQKQSNETVAKRVEKNTGKKRSEETKLRMSSANKAAWVIRKAKKLAEEGTQNA
jgi:group I intron endonuclease